MVKIFKKKKKKKTLETFIISLHWCFQPNHWWWLLQKIRPS